MPPRLIAVLALVGALAVDEPSAGAMITVMLAGGRPVRGDRGPARGLPRRAEHPAVHGGADGGGPSDPQQPLVAGFLACYVAGYVCMLAAPRQTAWLSMLLAGIGGGAFPLALTLIGLRTRSAANTAALSAVTQSAGYLFAGCGPVLVGVLHGATGGWTWPFVLLFAGLVLFAVSGWAAARPRFADDDIR